MTPAESYKRFGTITLSASVIRVLMKVDSSEGLDRSAMDLTVYSDYLPKDFQPVFEAKVVPKLRQRYQDKWVGKKEMMELARMIETEMCRHITKPTIDERVRRRDEKAEKVFGSPAFEHLFKLMDNLHDGLEIDMEIITPDDSRFETLRKKQGELPARRAEPPMEAICGIAYMLSAAATGHTNTQIFDHLETDHDGNLNHANLCVALRAKADVKGYTKESARSIVDALIVMGCFLKYSQDDDKNKEKGVPKVVENGIAPFGDHEAAYAMRYAAAVLRQASKVMDEMMRDNELPRDGEVEGQKQKENFHHDRVRDHQFIGRNQKL